MGQFDGGGSWKIQEEQKAQQELLNSNQKEQEFIGQ